MSLLDSEIEIIDKISIKDLIIEWLEKYDIKNYKINDDLTIDVNWDICLCGYSESQLPDYIQFNEVNGYFNISYSQIKTLKGCPKIVNDDFNCKGCPNLHSLKGAPEKICGFFDCSNCINLESLEGSPKIVYKYFCCSDCYALKSFKGSPEIVYGYFYYHRCFSLKTHRGGPKILKYK